MRLRPNRGLNAGPYGLFLVLLIGGCAGPIGTIRSEPPPPPAPTAFDGSYRTTIRVTSSFGLAQDAAWCSSPGDPVLTVAHGQFTYIVPHPDVTGSPTPLFPATFAADGSFSGQSGSGAISGYVRGNRIEGRIDGSVCIYTFTGNRV